MQDEISSFSRPESECLARHLRTGAKCLAFGLGDAARFMFDRGIWSLVAVDEDLLWLQAMAADNFFSFFMAKNRLSFYHTDIGPREAWGYPSTTPNPAWLNYHHGLWADLSPNYKEEIDIDFALVDGRFRVATACQCFLRCKPGLSLFMHDFWNRPAYHVLLDFLRVDDRVDSSAVLSMDYTPQNVRLAAICLQQHQFDIK